MDYLHFWEMLIALAELDLLPVAARAETVLVQTHGQTIRIVQRYEKRSVARGQLTKCGTSTGTQAIPFATGPHFPGLKFSKVSSKCPSAS